MEQKLDELLLQLHRYQFADAEQIISEFRHYILDKSHLEAELAFISARIFNSRESLLEFLRQNSQKNDRILSTVKKRIYELIIEYIKHRKQEVSSYLTEIKQTCMVSFISDQQSSVREASLQMLIKLIDTYKEIEPIIRPRELLNTLLDEIKLRKSSASVKGSIWQLVGLLHTQYPSQTGDRLQESQVIQFKMLKEQASDTRPEIKAINGMLKGFLNSLDVGCSLSQDQRRDFFVILSSLTQQLEDVTNRTVMKSAMKLLSKHASIFTDQIMSQAMGLIGRTLQLCTFENLEVRDSANDLLGALIMQISCNLDVNDDQHRRLFANIMDQFDQILHANDFKNVQLLSAIRAVGIFSKAIKTIQGDEKLWEYLLNLTELSEQKLIKEFMEQDKPESDLQNFKYILKKQKQLIAYIESYSFIIRNVEREPSETFLVHFMKVGRIGVNNHRKLYNKYRFRFYESLAQLTMSLSGFPSACAIWIKKFVRQSLTETLKIPDSVVYGGESPAESLADAVMFWTEYLSKDAIWTQASCQQVYHELVSTCLHDIEELDLNYKVRRTQKDFSESDQNQLMVDQHEIEYISNSQSDQQYLIRLTNFMEAFLPNCKPQWIAKWVPRFCELIVKKATVSPRIPKLYTILKVILQISSKQDFFSTMQSGGGHMEVDQDNSAGFDFRSEQLNTYNMLLTFLKELIGKQEEFQDELLQATLQLLLHVPTVIIYQAEKGKDAIDNLHLWKSVMIKALNLSYLDNNLAMTCISTLENWFNALPMSLVAQLYEDLLPKLSPFLQAYTQVSNQETYFFQDLIKETREERVDRQEIANKVLDLLGKIGGHAHSIISNQLTKKHDKENFIRWDSEKRLKFALPLANDQTIDVYFDSCLPRIIDLAQNSPEKKTRIHACELLHGLVLYMIGKSATMPQQASNSQQHESMAAFAKLYARLFPVIIRLATEIEQISRQLFEPLVFQIVRWFSSSKIFEHPEVASLLDALVEGTQSRNNSAQRELCSDAIAVFAKWSLKHMTDTEIKENPANIKSLLRRIESNSNHPDPFKRLSSLVCFSKIINVVKDYDTLIDRFLLEIARCVLSSLKMCHNSLELSQDVMENCSALLKFIQKIIELKANILFTKNEERSVHSDLHEFLDYLFSKFTAVETVFRREAIKLWEGLVLSQKNRLQIQSLILKNYVPSPGEKVVFWQITAIQFGEKASEETKRVQYIDRQKKIDTLIAQLEFISWLLKVANFKYSELTSRLKIDIRTIKTNIGSFIFDYVRPNYVKNCKKGDINSLMICKEDREQLTRSELRLFTQLFLLIDQLNDGELADFFVTPTGQGGHEFLLDLAIQIIVVPAAHKLNLLVQDYKLERKLRIPCESFVKRVQQTKDLGFDLPKIVQRFTEVDLPQADLANIRSDNCQDYHPRILSNLLLGYLKLSQICPSIRAKLQSIATDLPAVVESWIQSGSIFQEENTKLLINFMTQLHIPNETLSNWISTKSEIYHKSSDLLLKYIADNWIRDDIQVGSYLVEKTKENQDLLSVLIPILDYICERVAGYQTVFIEKIPLYWNIAEHNADFAEKQVQIYSIILQKCSWTFQTKQQQSLTFINFVIQQAKNFLQLDRFNIYFQKQVLNLIGLIYSLELVENVHQKLKSVLESFLTKQSPICSRDLRDNKNQAINYEKLLEGFFDLLDLSRSPQILYLLRRVVAEHKPEFLAERIRSSLNNFVTSVVNKQASFALFYQIVDQFFASFFDYKNQLLEDNYRWAVAHKLINRVLETCSAQYLEELFVKIFETKLKEPLERPVQQLKDLDLYFLVREQTHILLMLEIFVRRLESDTMRGRITQSLYGMDAPAQKLTLFFLKISDTCLHRQLSLDQCDIGQVQLPEINSVQQVFRRYACAAYTLLSSTILKTQERESVFTKNLFQNWEALMDTTTDYVFHVETNFNSISLQAIEKKAFKEVDIAETKQHNLLNEYVTASFMATNSNFNSTMVFETQLPQSDKGNQPIMSLKEKTEQREREKSILEIDQVNKHECMKNIKRCLDRMHELFHKEWSDLKGNAIPEFMQTLLEMFARGNMNLRVFILKLLVNNQNLFMPFAKFFVQPICQFITGKQTGGKGFHYFLRDLTTLLIVWSDQYELDTSKRSMYSGVINTLMMIAADKRNTIFYINIEIIAMLIRKWQPVIAMDKTTLTRMLRAPDEADGSHLWKMTAIQMVALACNFDVPVVADTSEVSEQKFKLSDGHDDVLVAMSKLQELKKKQLIFASSEALGKMLAGSPSHSQTVIQYIMLNDARERHDILVNVIERITREFPKLLAQRRIFLKLLSFINVMTGSMRGAIFKALHRYYRKCSQTERLEIIKSIQAISEEILSDISEENQKNYLILLSEIVQTQKQSVFCEILDKVIHRLKDLFVQNKSETLRELFYDLMVVLYDKFSDYKVYAKSSLIRGLVDESDTIKSKIIEYWNCSVRLSTDPRQRIEQLLTVLYDQEEEKTWLNNAVYLLLQTSTISANYTRKLFDEPLKKCRFHPLHIDQFKMNLHRSQPVTPSLAQFTLEQASQYMQRMTQKRQQLTLQAIKEDVNESDDRHQSDVEMKEHDSAEFVDSQEKLAVAGQQKGPHSQDRGSQASNQIRATQQPGQALFNPSQMDKSSLFVSNMVYTSPQAHGISGIYSQSQGSQQDYSFSQAFYEGPDRRQPRKLKIFHVSDELNDNEQPGMEFAQPVFLGIQRSPQKREKTEKEQSRSEFFKRSEISYNPVMETQGGSMIRIVKDGSMPTQLARKEEFRRQQQISQAKNYRTLQKEQISMLRQYRVGEIPDIQIDYKDILDPLMVLIKLDQTIATEVLVELFTQMYKSSKDPDFKKRLGDGVAGILSASIKFDYGMINTMHRIAIELLKIDGFSLQADVIEKTGRASMSFQTSLLLLEETIIYGKLLKQQQSPQVTKFNLGRVNNETKTYWFSMIQMYELVGNEDSLKGIWSSIGEQQSVMLKDELSLENSEIPKLIKRAQTDRSKGQIKDSLKKLEEILQNPEFATYFEDQVQTELQNKKYESNAELLRWENITTIAKRMHSQKQLFEIPSFQAETMIRAQLRIATSWPDLNSQMQMWHADPISKVYLERRFNYEQALLHVTVTDFDRARFYINREANDLLTQWKDLTKLSQVAQHILVQKIQKIYEMKEFLNTMKQMQIKEYEDLTPDALSQISNWIQRQPSCSFDKLAVWDDILTSRMLFIDVYKLHFRQGSSFVNQLENTVPSSFKNVQNISAKLYAQVAKGARKMGLYDSSDQYLMTCLKKRETQAKKDDLRLIVPIIKLKIEQVEQETIDSGLQLKYSKLSDALRVLDTKINHNLEVQNPDAEIMVKALSCKQNLHKKLVNILYKNIVLTRRDARAGKEYQDSYIGHMKQIFATHSQLETFLAGNSLGKQESQKAKILHNFAKINFKILRREEEPALQPVINKGAQQVGKTMETLALQAIKYTFEAIDLGCLKARDQIPRLLDLVQQSDSTRIENLFVEASSKTPVWIFLRWINQIVAFMNRPKCDVIAEKVRQIQRKYPQALYYPFKVIQSNFDVDMLGTAQEPSQLFLRTHKNFEKKFENLALWTEALESLMHPEHRLLSWLELLEDKIRQGGVDTDYLKALLQLVIDDVGSERPGLGVYNKKFAKSWRDVLKKLQGRAHRTNDLVNHINKLSKKLLSIKLNYGAVDVSTFSEYLSQLDNNDFYNNAVYIEVPGQYENINSEPIPGKHVKIACIREQLLILGSIRRPKRITIHGSNEKDYNLLIKGGEDLRLDQRIQQLFSIMNDIFKDDPVCQSRDLNLKTFNVVPVTNRLGCLEWVNDTEPLKEIINREHIRMDRQKRNLSQSYQQQKVRQFLADLPDNKGVDDIKYQHLSLLMQPAQKVIEGFNENKQYLQWSLLRQGLENLCLTSQAFITIKNQFVKSIAVFSIASYLLGIGDRHLENFLVNTNDGEVLGIDYGCAFGSGVQLAIPELIPFRLTQQIEGVIAPHSMEGVYKQTMVHALIAIKKRKSIILDTCDIFVQEPLLDWISQARQHVVRVYGEDQNKDEELKQLSFYPKQKIQVLRDKLNGKNPVIVLSKELEESQHQDRPYYERLLEAIRGQPNEIRKAHYEKGVHYMDTETQVDCLIELARSPDILGRAWIGWGAFI